MAWFFGSSSQGGNPNDNNAAGSTAGGSAQATAGQAAADATLSKAERKAMEAYRFDSSALERAADAAKTLEKSSELLDKYFHRVLINSNWNHY